jgi:hypothetical protein
MMMPNQQLWNQLLSTPAGVWSVRLHDGENVFVIKASRAFAKFVMLGKRAELVVSTMATRLGDVRVLGFRLYDDEEYPVAMMRPVTSADDLRALDALLNVGRARFEVFDDSCLSALTAFGALSPNKIVLRPAKELGTDQREVGSSALDDFERVLEGKPPANVLETHIVAIKFHDLTPSNVDVVGFGRFHIGTVNEGDELERSTEMLLHHILDGLVVRGPRLAEQQNLPEMCDVLGFGPDFKYTIVVQAKVDGVLAASAARTGERRKMSIMKNLRTAIAQGEGAARALRRGAALDLNGKVLTLPTKAMERIHVLILLSEMHGGLEWEVIASELLTASDTSTFFHLMDLAELQSLVSALSGRPNAAALIEPNLLQRWLTMKDQGTAFIHARRR